MIGIKREPRRKCDDDMAARIPNMPGAPQQVGSATVRDSEKYATE
jgi:hypothetical protein